MTLVIAHRGASAYAPENTVAACELAVQMGADMIELDVQRTSDGELVVFHDETTERWDGRKRLASACSLAELRTLDIGGQQVATLAEICELARRRGIALNVELKQPDIVGPTVQMIYEFGLSKRVIISSFYEAALAELLRTAPQLERGYLMGTDTYRPDVRARELWPFLALKQVAARAWHPYFDLPAIEQIIPLVRKAGYAVNVWTIDDPTVMKHMIELGATGIITNKPDVARQVIPL
jgi:glycerophosphoryl diester phosphodiesterase